MKKKYYLMKLWQESPLRISSGEGENSDNDLMLDGRGIPYIPGSSLTGVLRDMLTEDNGNQLFGTLSQSNHIIISDATLNEDSSKFVISVRDGVGLSDDGVAEKQKKYDFETLICENPFFAVLEVDEEGFSVMEKLLKEIGAARGIRVGGRTTRGYGRLSVEIREHMFTFPQDIMAWMDYDPRSPKSWEIASPVTLIKKTSEKNTYIQVEFRLKGSMIIRQSADYEGINSTYLATLKGDSAIIPGTSWAGIFRHHMRNLAKEVGWTTDRLEEIDSLFGKTPVDSGAKKSDIVFSETCVSGGKPYSYKRIGVDRFTAAPSVGKLYANEYYQGGKGTLEIEIPRKWTEKWKKQILAACLLDLDRGLLHFGGEGSVGRGVAEITDLTVNGISRLEGLKSGDIGFLDEEGDI